MSQPPSAQPPATQPPATQPPATQPPATQPSGGPVPDTPEARAARLRFELAVAAAGALPLHQMDPSDVDLSRVQPLLERLAGAVASLLGTDIAAVWTVEPRTQVLLPSAWVGFDDDYISALRVPFGAGSAGRAVAEGRSVLIDDVMTSDDYGPWRAGALAHGVRAVLSVPMLTLGGEPMGALSSYYRAPTVPDPRDVELALVYGQQAAELVDRARLYGQAHRLAEVERRRGLQLRAMADSALSLSQSDSLQALLSVLVASAVTVVGAAGGRASRAGAVPLTCTAGAVPQDPVWVSAPLVGRDGAELGRVELSRAAHDPPFSADDQAVLVQLAQTASSAVESLEALERERQARQEAEAAAAVQSVLSQASAVFAESFEPQGIVQALAGLAVPRLAELAVVHVLDDEVVRLAAVHTADPADQPRAWDLLTRFRIEPDQPYGVAAVLATGRPQLLPEITAEMAASLSLEPDLARQLRSVVHRSVVIVPLTARGRLTGTLALSRVQPYGEADVEHALDLARRAALALDNAARYAFERDLAVTLQRSLLPRQLPAGGSFTAAARYLPGERGTQVGGDWYDAIEVGDELVLVVGDVMGRGVQAAAVMGQLQATVRAYALEGHGPAALLTRLDQVVLAVEDLHFTTCVVARIDPATGRGRLASAGHLPPVVVDDEGRALLLDLDPGLPLGVGGAEFVESDIVLEPGSLLVLYTDGLVESREVALQQGLDALVVALTGPVDSADQVCDRVLTALHPESGHDDDTAILVLQVAGQQPWQLALVLPAEPESAARARHALRSLRVVQSDVAELLVSELVANAVRHAGDGDVVVRAASGETGLRVEVVDTSRTLPGEAGDPEWESESGRGLLLIEMLSTRWGAEALAGGKRVWFELAPDS